VAHDVKQRGSIIIVALWAVSASATSAQTQRIGALQAAIDE